MADEGTARVLERFAQMSPSLGPTLEERRRGYDSAVGFAVPEDAEIRREVVAGVPCIWVAAPGSDHGKTVIVLHGGGYVMGSAAAYSEFAYRVSAAAGAGSLVIDYRLAPEHPYPAAVDDVLNVYRTLVEHTESSRIVLVGDSAGGGLLMGSLVAMRDEGMPRAAGAAVLSPFVDLDARADSFVRNADTDPVVTAASLRRHGAMYLGGREARRTPWASPNHADLSDLPPVLVMVSSTEALLDDSLELAARVRSAGGSAQLEVVDGMIHVWPLFGQVLPEGREAVTRIGSFFASRWGAGDLRPS